MAPLLALRLFAARDDAPEAQDGERTLLRRARTGDPVAFRLLFERHSPAVWRFLKDTFRDEAAADEATQETFVRAHGRLATLRDEDRLASWLLGIARHKLVDYWRRLGREERSLRTIATREMGSDQVEDPWDVHLDSLRARETLERLAAQHRTVLTLRYLDDLPVADVAEILERTVHATEALLVRARSAFRRAYTEQEDASCA